MRAVKTHLYKAGTKKQQETFSYKELRLLAKSITFDGNKTSSINKSLDKAQAYSFLIEPFLDEEKYHDDVLVEPILFKNIIREFVLKQKTMTERFRKVKIIKEVSDYRDEKINKIINE